MTFSTPGGLRRRIDDLEYLDLNGNGVLDPYEDPRLSVSVRVEDLLRRLSLAEKAGLMFHTMTSVSETGALSDVDARPGRPGLKELLGQKFINHLNVHSMPEPRTMAGWVNRLQQQAISSSPHGIPVTLSTDPRHSFSENWGASFFAEHFSAWPEPIGLAALRDEDTVREFARVVRAEYTAVGLRAALHPSIDLATEPRWARQYGTFGQDPDLSAGLAVAYLDELEGNVLGEHSVACMAKHFPGGGPQRDGEDPHFPYGREQIYPGGRFEDHLAPFRAVVERGVSAIMPYYGVPIGLIYQDQQVEELGFGFNRRIVTGLLREELGYQGVVCTDWGLVTPSELHGRTLPARSWGVENLDTEDRVLRILNAGCDQLGGEDIPEVVVRLVEKDRISEGRVDESARRLLRVKFELGLFDNPFVDEESASSRTRTPEFITAGLRAQASTVTVLENRPATDDSSILPLQGGTEIYSEGVDHGALVEAGLRPVATPEAAQIVLLRAEAPFDLRDEYMLESAFRAGSLEYEEALLEHVETLSALAPVVLVVHLDRPAVLTPLQSSCTAIVGVYGTSDAALLEALTGAIPPQGRLPFELPRSMTAVQASYPDAASATSEPLYQYGHGLTI